MKTLRKKKIARRGKPAAKRRVKRTAPALVSATPWKLRRSARLQILESPALARLPWLVHAFSTRPGGSSELPAPSPESDRASAPTQAALNLGFTEWDQPDRVHANRKQFFRALGAQRFRVVALRQIHSDIIHLVSSALPASLDPPKGDALITSAPGILLTVQTADCVPILLADSRRRAIAAIHSGWRGTVRRIAEKTLGRMRMEFGTRPQDVIAAIGPAIGPECYEVGHEVVQQFAAAFPEARAWFDGPFDALSGSDADPNWLPWLTMRPPGHAPPPPRAQLDLVAANRSILAGAGVPPAQISSSGFCTSCRADLLFSYRRQRATGRLMAAIAIR